jgi:hypothetical protein
MDSDWAIFAPKQIPVYPNANENKNISYGNMFFMSSLNYSDKIKVGNS